jgi:hypothetical protein
MASKFQIPIAFKSDPRGLKEAESALGGFGKKLAGIGAAVAGAFAVRAVFNFGQEALLAAEGVATANARLEAIAKATQVFGAETNKVTKSLIAFAEAQELVVAVDAEVIKGVQAQLLSFKKLSASAGEVGGVFERVTMAAFDMAAAGFGSAESNAIALGKAFEDPIRGLTALRRSGTVFTEDQQKLIKSLVETGDLLGAQTIILEELETQYGGTAEATANFSDRMALAFDNVKEALGAALLPAFEGFATFFIEEVVPPLVKFFEEDFPRLIEKARPVIEGIMEFFTEVGEGLKQFLDIDADTSLLEGILDKLAALGDNEEFTQFIETVLGIFETMAPILGDIVENIGLMAEQLSPLLIGAIEKAMPVLEDFSDILDGINYFLQEILDRFVGFEDETPKFLNVVDYLVPALALLQRGAELLANAFERAVTAYERFKAIGGVLPSEEVTGGRRFARAVGGPVSADRSYLVGERGPEIFTPGAGGFITPNNRLGGSSGPTYNITVNAGMGTNGAQLGEQIVSAIKRYERSSGPVFASA